jgi:transposase-like protein
LNNIVEQDHRRVKQRICPMLGFKSFRIAAVAISGIELAQKIRMGQHDTSAVTVIEGASVQQLWETMLAA